MTCKEQIESMVNNTVDEIESSKFDFEDILEVEYRISSDGDFRGFEATLAIGGPALFVNENKVEAYWGSDNYESNYIDKSGLYDYFEELYNATR